MEPARAPFHSANTAAPSGVLSPGSTARRQSPPRRPGLRLAALSAFAVTGLCYWAYYALAPWIWAQNVPVSPETILRWVLAVMPERDGLEIYALYVLMFVVITGTLGLG
jgi:hypothetical protein